MKFTKDTNGKGKNIVRKCTANIAKMNMREYIFYSVFHWDAVKSIVIDTGIGFINIFNSIFMTIFGILAIFCMPIILLVTAYKDIKRSKAFMLAIDKKTNRIDKDKFKRNLNK